VDTLGAKSADTLVSYLPPVGWADVATKHDLDATRHMLELHVTAQIYQAMNRQTWQMVGAFAGLQALMLAALKLL